MTIIISGCSALISEIPFTCLGAGKQALGFMSVMVGMTGEKAETREMKEKLAGYFRRKDVAGAKTYFMERLKKRPDVLMEASDITGERSCVCR